MDYAEIRLDQDDGIQCLVLNRPQALNAFTVRIADELIDAFGRASEDDSVRVVIVTGEGKAFCAGMDLGSNGNVFGLDERQAPTLADMEQCLDAPHITRGVRDTGGRLAFAIIACKKPVIAAINGAAVDIGAAMLLSMDIRLAADHARFGFLFGRVGITPEACSSWLLPAWSASPRRWSCSTVPMSSMRKRRCAAACCAPWCLRPTCAQKPNAWRAASSAGARRCRRH